jgi:hypothetical protein
MSSSKLTRHDLNDNNIKSQQKNNIEKSVQEAREGPVSKYVLFIVNQMKKAENRRLKNK